GIAARRATTRAGGPHVSARSTTAERRAALSTNRAWRMADAGSGTPPIAPATSASARPVTPPPHGFSRGCDASKIVTRAPRRASEYAAHAPAGPAPTMATSVSVNIFHRRWGPHPQRELTLMRRRWLCLANGAAWPQALLMVAW